MWMKIAAGSYERFLWAWEADPSSGELKEAFNRPAHIGPIKCVAGWGTNLVTGGTDDTMHIFDVRSYTDFGIAEAHTGSVTALTFFGTTQKASHLFSASEDGTICVWDTERWMHLKTMKGKSGIYDFTVHPTGKVGLSVEKGGGFRMWNLLRGSCSFKSEVSREAFRVRFMPEQENAYALVCGNNVEMHNADDGKTFQTLVHGKPVLCLVPFQDKLLFTGGEECSLNAWDIRSGKLEIVVPEAHSRRVKGIDVLDNTHYITSASSDGFVKVWDTRVMGTNGNEKPKPLLEADTKARLTCIVAFSATSDPLRLENTGDAATEEDDDALEHENVNSSEEEQENDDEDNENVEKSLKRKKKQKLKRLLNQKLKRKKKSRK